jgi:hypothetical protein
LDEPYFATPAGSRCRFKVQRAKAKTVPVYPHITKSLSFRQCNGRFFINAASMLRTPSAALSLTPFAWKPRERTKPEDTRWPFGTPPNDRPPGYVRLITPRDAQDSHVESHDDTLLQIQSRQSSASKQQTGGEGQMKDKCDSLLAGSIRPNRSMPVHLMTTLDITRTGDASQHASACASSVVPVPSVKDISALEQVHLQLLVQKFFQADTTGEGLDKHTFIEVMTMVSTNTLCVGCAKTHVSNPPYLIDGLKSSL